MDYDDWLFESIRRYDKLSMYHINGLVTATDWVNAKGMLVATDSGTSSKHELMELHLPDKIIDDDISLSKDRDFRVASGCFTDRKVNCVRHIPGTRNCVLAKDGTAAIEMYEMGDNSSNLIKPAPGRVISLDHEHNTAGRSVKISNLQGRNAVVGYNTGGLKIVDVETFQLVHNMKNLEGMVPPTQQISDIHLNNNSTAFCCTDNGTVLQFDIREKSQCSCKTLKSYKPECHWRLAVSDKHIWLASSAGDVLCACVEDMQDIQSLSIEQPWTTHKDVCSHLCIQSNNDGRKFSISGFDGNVYVYQMVDQHCRLEFVHDGHVMNRDDQTESISVLQHVWFPDSQDQVVSMATDGSLHAWKHR
ncbi:WD repeat-containing protein 73-like [Mya arenaria]|uniref:WD repeat-containing protein 73-like n=1 Tax=Mya arenaria TaxID=6604 RepID=UPI0022E06743|nr:WD repeat-containing protein 73-like [Mya arenaria]